MAIRAFPAHPHFHEVAALIFRGGWDAREAEVSRLKRQLEVAREVIDRMLPIVEEAFWDHHTAGLLPGSGYNHRVYRKISEEFGWRDSKIFTDFKTKIDRIGKE